MAEWLDRVRRGMASTEQELDQALRYYGGPHVYNALRKTLGLVNAVSPVEDIGAAVAGSGEAMQGAMEGELLNAATGLMDMASGLGGAFMPGPTEDLAQIGMMLGPMARKADHESLAEAIKLEQKGAPREETMQSTGWRRGPDGKWRFEISDANRKMPIREQIAKRSQEYSAIREDLKEAMSLANRKERLGGISTDEAVESYTRDFGQPPTEAAIDYVRGGYTTKDIAALQNQYNKTPHDQPFKLKDLLQEPELYENYPELADMPVRLQPVEDTGYLGSYSPNKNEITLDTHTAMQNDPDFVLGHEIQHAIQTIEGFAPGGTSNTTVADKIAPVKEEYDKLMQAGAMDKFSNWMKMEQMKGRRMTLQKAMDKYAVLVPTDRKFKEIHRLEKAFRLLDAQGKADYAKLAGEVESKNVQARKDMSLDTLMDIPAWQTQGVPDEDQIVLPPYIPRNRR